MDALEIVALVAAVTVGFPLALAGMFALVTSLLSALGGWGRIAATYPLRGPVTGRTLRMQPGRVGLASYRYVLTVTVADEGLAVSVMPLFRVGHPPMFLPWTALRNLRRTRFLMWEVITFDVGEPRIGRMALPAAVFEGRPLPR